MLQLWTELDGQWRFFVETEPSHCQVGQTWQDPNGSWVVEVNDNFVSVPTLNAAIELFVSTYDPSRVMISPGTPLTDEELSNDKKGFEIIDLRQR